MLEQCYRDEFTPYPQTLDYPLQQDTPILREYEQGFSLPVDAGETAPNRLLGHTLAYHLKMGRGRKKKAAEERKRREERKQIIDGGGGGGVGGIDRAFLDVGGQIDEANVEEHDCGVPNGHLRCELHIFFFY